MVLLSGLADSKPAGASRGGAAVIPLTRPRTRMSTQREHMVQQSMLAMIISGAVEADLLGRNSHPPALATPPAYVLRAHHHATDTDGMVLSSEAS